MKTDEQNTLIRILQASRTDTVDQVDAAIELLQNAMTTNDLIAASIAGESACAAARNHFRLERRISNAMAAAA